MPIWDGQGRRVCFVRAPGRPYRVTQWLSPVREGWYVLRFTGRDWHVRTRPRQGAVVLCSVQVGDGAAEQWYPDPFAKGKEVIRRQVHESASVIRPALPADTKILAKLPQLVAFLRDTSYDDGSARTPGYLWLTNRWSSYEVTLFDPDACCRISVNGSTLDDALSLAEAVLRAPETPWMPDQYMLDRAAKKKKK